MNINIRKATKSDVSFISKFCLSLMQYHSKPFSSALYEPKENILPLLEKIFETSLDEDKYHILVAETGNKIIAYSVGEIIIRPEKKIEKEGHYIDLFVDPGFRCKKIGSQLLTLTREWFIEQGAGIITGDVAFNNEIMLNYFEKKGYSSGKITVFEVI